MSASLDRHQKVLLITVDDGGAEDEGSWSWSRKRTEWDDDVSSLAVIISHVQRK